MNPMGTLPVYFPESLSEHKVVPKIVHANKDHPLGLAVFLSKLKAIYAKRDETIREALTQNPLCWRQGKTRTYQSLLKGVA